MPRARLVLCEPFQPARHIPIQPTPFIIGRTSDCQLVLQHPSISGQHAALLDRRGELYLQDLGSKNGSLVNGMAARDTTLQHRDLISLGGVDLVFEKVGSAERRCEVRERLERLSQTLEWTATFKPDVALDQILDQVIEGLMQLSRARRGCLLVSDDRGSLRIARSRGIRSGDLEVAGSLSSTALAKARDELKAVVVSNAADDSLYGRQASVVAMGLKTLIAVPVQALDGDLLGLLYADSDTIEQTFAELDLQVLTSLAASAALALENADLGQQIQRLAAQASEALAEVAGETDLGEELQLSVHRTRSALERVGYPAAALPGDRADSNSRAP